MNRYVAVGVSAFRRRLSSVSEFAGRAGLYLIILGVWWKIWSSTDFGAFRGFTPSDALWYLMGTEWIVLSIPYVYMDIEADVRSGDLGFALLRPGHYSLYQLATAMGLAVANWLVLGVVGFAIAWWLTGELSTGLLQRLPAIALLALAALLVCCVVMVVLGLVSVWTSDASPCAWVWQKLLFVVGGLMLPLSVYPQWLQDAAIWTPFPYLLGNVAEALLSPAPSLPLWVAALAIVGWGGALLVVLAIVDRLAIRRALEAA